MMEFEFSFVTPKDGKFGGKMKNGLWNGLVADLANGVSGRGSWADLYLIGVSS